MGSAREGKRAGCMGKEFKAVVGRGGFVTRMARSLVVAGLGVMLSACAIDPDMPVRVSGYYIEEGASRTFIEDDWPKPYWVAATPDALAALQAPLPEGRAENSVYRVRAEVAARASQPGHYGEDGAYDYIIYISDVYSAELYSVNGVVE